MTNTRKIVVIMTDTQRWDMVNCYRETGLKTPCIDALAASGVRFERAYTTQPVCGPARSALFTGLFPHSNGSVTNSVSLYDNVKTIGQRLRDHGFHNAYIGKWHLDGGDYFGVGRCPDGWDPQYWYDMRCYLEELTPEERLKSRSPAIMEKGVPAEFTYGHRCTNRALDFLEKNNKDDFLLVVSYDEPHDPYVCPEPYASMYKDYEFPKPDNAYDTLANKPDFQRAWEGQLPTADKAALKITHPRFFGCNSFIDSEIGRVVEAVDKFAPDALIIYTSDHGDFLKSHALHGKGPAGYDEITRIPLIIRQRGAAAPGVCPHPVSHIDIVPTILTAAGIPLPKWIEGKPLTPAISDPEARVNEAVFIEFTRYEIDHDGFGGFQPMRAVFDGRYKLCVNLLSTDELYDTFLDPGEMVNLIESPGHTAARDALHDRLLNWMNDTRDPYRGYYWERRPWRTDARPASWRYTGMTRQRENEEYEPRQLDYATGLEITEAARMK